MEKMWPYETDVRIPFYIAGPGIAPGQTPDVMGVNIDIAPTLLALAGIDKPNQMDGQSLLPLIMGDAQSKAKAAAGWRTRTIIAFAEGKYAYWGIPDFPAFPASAFGQNNSCSHDQPIPGPVPWEGWTGGCISGLINTEAPLGPRPAIGGVNYTFDNPENQWRMLRVKNATADISYMQWDPLFVFEKIAFHAYFDIATDPLQQRNLWLTLSATIQKELQREMVELFSCHGTASNQSNCP